MNKKGFSLVQLDEYAKRLTQKQANMLYENRMHKKYKKMLCEAHTINEDEDFSLYLDDAAFYEVSRAEILAEITGIDQSVKSRTTPTGIYFYTDMPDVYVDIINTINEYELSDYVDNVEPGYEHYLA